MSEDLQKQFDALKQQHEQLKGHIKNLTAQIEAHKQILNESVQSAGVVRTNFVLYQQAHQELANEYNKVAGFLDAANKQVLDLQKELEVAKNDLVLAKMDNESIRNALNAANGVPSVPAEPQESEEQKSDAA